MVTEIEAGFTLCRGVGEKGRVEDGKMRATVRIV
jgi:hypothetical protein